MKRVLLTGANGFIGRHCVPSLLKKGFEVHAVLSEAGKKPELGSVLWHTANLLDSKSLSTLLEKIQPSHLLHFAWITTPGVYWTSEENLRWVQASLELLRNFKSQGGRRAVMAGSCAEYDWRYGYSSEAVTPLNPATLYGSCKKALCEMLMSFADQEGLSAAWGRIFFLYGPHEHPTRLVPSVVRALLHDQPALCTHGNQIRDFLHVDDVASAFASLLDSEVEGAVNIASGEPVAIQTVVHRIAEKIGRPDLVRLGAVPASASDAPLLVGDASRLNHEVKWSPRHSLEDGLEMTITWWKKQE